MRRLPALLFAVMALLWGLLAPPALAEQPPARQAPAENAGEVMEWSVLAWPDNGAAVSGAAIYDPGTGVLTLMFEQNMAPFGDWTPENLKLLNCSGPQAREPLIVEIPDWETGTVHREVLGYRPGYECGRARLVRQTIDGLPRTFMVYNTPNVTIGEDRITFRIEGADAYIRNIEGQVVSAVIEATLLRDPDDPARFEGPARSEQVRRRVELGGTVLGGGTTSGTGRMVWYRKRIPEIHDVFVLEDQLARNELDEPLYPYPFGDDPKARARGKTARTIFVVGRNLPRSFSAPLRLASADPRISLRLDAIDGAPGNVGTERARFAKGWARFAARSGKTRDGLEAVILKARLAKGVLGGRKGFSLNGARALWKLDFGDAEGRLDFLRVVAPPEGAGPGGGKLEKTSVAYVNDAIRLRITLANRFPIEQLDLELGPPEILQIDLKRAGLGPATMPRAVLSLKRSDTDPRVYLSDPLHVVERDDTGQDRPPGDSGLILRVATPSQVLGKLDDRRIRLQPAYSALDVETSPDEVGGSFVKALKRAAACSGADVAGVDWDRLTTRKEKDISNLLITEFGTRSVPVSHGDHAAMLLLRDEFIRRMKSARKQYRTIAGDDRLILGLMRSINPLTLDRSAPLYRVPVPDPEDLSTTMSFGRFLFLNDDLSPEQRIRPARTAIGELVRAITVSLKMAEAIDDCDIEGLLQLTGSGFGAVVRGLEPKLMRARYDRAHKRLKIEPDVLGRAAVRNLSVLADAVRAQRAYSRADTDYALAIGAAALSGGASAVLGEGLLASASAFAVDVAVSGVSGAANWADYLASRKELRFALGASAVLGTDRLDTAELEKVGWDDVLFQSMLDALGVATGVAADAVSIAKAASAADAVEMIARGEQIAQSLARDTGRALDPAEAADLAAFLGHAKSKALTRGRASLTDLEREILERAESRARLTSLVEGAPAGSGLRGAEAGTEEVAAARGGDFGEALPGAASAPDDLTDTVILANPPRTGDDLTDTVILKDPNATLRGTPEELADGVKRSDAARREFQNAPTERFSPRDEAAMADTVRQDAPTERFSPGEAGGAASDKRLRAGGDKATTGGTRTARFEQPEFPPLTESRSAAATATEGADTVILKNPPRTGDELARMGVPGTPPRTADDFVKTAPPRIRAGAPAAGGAHATPLPIGPIASGTPYRARISAPGGPPVELALEKRLGAGGYNEVFSLAGRDDAVARISLRPAEGPDLDEFGRRFLEKVLPAGQPRSAAPIDIVRRIDDIPGLPGGRIARIRSADPHLDGKTIEILERLPEGAASAQIARQGGMTPGQAAAFDEGMRWLNRRGLVWLDNHPGNFAFRNLGGDNWQMVVLDPGGIVPARASDLGNAATTAAKVQRILDSPPPEFRSAFDFGNMEMRWQVKREVIQEEVLPGRVDLGAVGIPSADRMPFFAASIETFPELARLRALDDAAAEQARAALKARKDLIPRVNPKTGEPLQ